MSTIDIINAKIKEITDIVMEANENGEDLGVFLLAAQDNGEGYECAGSVSGTKRSQVHAVIGAMKGNKHCVEVILKASEALFRESIDKKAEEKKAIEVKPNSTRS